ncbi:histone deacetylase HDT1-like [Corylus avellana]|uniref:histone deacetylase HDT1-like n=1 Tax=Corylus avellana TaxID=13451 RepID=UPI00286A98DD|nr:histone deacetylase HDT1-like [Corylus avellana]
MEFWGVEVKAGQPLKVKPGDDKLIHLSQASLGESKNKANDSVPLHLKFGDQKLVLGTLSQEKFPQLSFDLVFEKEFELSHNWKQGSVYFCGYRADSPDEEDHDEFDTDSEDDEEILPLSNAENGKADSTIATKSASVKPESSEKSVKLVEPSKDDEDDDSIDQDMDDDSDDEDDSDDDDELGIESDDDSDEEPEETPKKAEKGKKRTSDSALKTPVPTKKAKQATPQKTDGKKGVHTATPHPSKNAGKTAGNSEQSKGTPKSGGQFACKSCIKTFGSEVGLQSHTKAKHSAN